MAGRDLGVWEGSFGSRLAYGLGFGGLEVQVPMACDGQHWVLGFLGAM